MKNLRLVYSEFVRKTLTLCLMTFMFLVISAQESSREAPSFKERLFFGGNFSLQLGTITNIEVSPIIGLWVRPRIAVAIGPDYKYYSDTYSNPSIKTSIYGGRAYVQLVVFRDLNKFLPLGNGTSLFLQIEDEMLSLDSYIWKNISIPPHRFQVNTVLAGAGLSQQIGRRAAVNFMVLWSIGESDPDIASRIYSNPEIRIGFVF